MEFEYVLACLTLSRARRQPWHLDWPRSHWQYLKGGLSVACAGELVSLVAVVVVVVGGAKVEIALLHLMVPRAWHLAWSRSNWWDLWR